MFLSSLVMDPEEERRRRLRRARIVRRNRITREVAMGLPVRLRRAPRAATPVLDGADLGGAPVDRSGQYQAATAPFRPTFGGNGDDVMHVSEMRARQFLPAASAAKPRTRRRPEAPSTPPEDATTAMAAPSAPVLAASRPTAAVPARRMNARVLQRWQEAVDRVLVRRHLDILSKDPERRWRQERLGLRLFARGEYARAAGHLRKAISLGATSGACWRRLAQCHWRHWELSGDWMALWDCRGAYEQALAHVEVACSPFALFEYARALESLGDYSGALGVCAAILATFPRFQQRTQVVLRYVLLQRYELFPRASGHGEGAGDAAAHEGASSVAAIDRHMVLLKCIGYTKELLLDESMSEGDQCIEVLYMHARLNELLVLESAPDRMAAVSTIAAASTGVALATATADRCFDELLRAAVHRQVLSARSSAPGKRPWRERSETYTAFAQYFQQRNEPVPASDALARALELLEEPPSTPEASAGVSSEDRRARIELYVVLGRTYYQSNQMEKAVRSMEAVFGADPFHQEARASLAEWFPDKWKFRLDLEDASQVQIARVLRGAWGRERASAWRKAAEQRAERQWRLEPYNPTARRAVLQLRRDTYAPLFAAQELSARVLQQQARKFLRFARLRWANDERHATLVNDLLRKLRTRKYRYNRRVRAQLAQLLPREYEARFEREEAAARLVQRRFRGYRVRQAYLVRREAHRAAIASVRLAAERIRRFLGWCVVHGRRQQQKHAQTMDELLVQARDRVVRAKERVARGLQSCFRRGQGRRSATDVASLVVAQSRASSASQRRADREQCATRIQLAWKRYTSGQHESCRTGRSSVASVVEAARPGTGTGSKAARRSVEARRDSAARKIQGQFRRKTIRESLGKLKRVPAPPSPSVIGALLAKIDANHCSGGEPRALVSSFDTIEQRRALFECPVVVFRGEQRRQTSSEARIEGERGSEAPPATFIRHLANAIQFSASLRCLVCDSGDFGSSGAVEVMKAVGLGKSLRVLALGAVDLDSAMDPTELGRNPRAPTAMQALSKAVRTANFLLEELYVEGNTLLEDAAEGARLAEIVGDFFFARYGHLHTLVAARARLSDASAELLAAALSINTVLRHLDLHGNGLGDAAAVAFATRGLPFNATLRYLSLADNAVGSPGAIALFRSLERDNHALETLVLANNNVRNDAVASLLAAWKSNAAVESVELAGNLVHGDHLRALTAAKDERRAVLSASAELRLFLARRRFASGMASAPLSPASPVRSGRGSNRGGASKRRPREAVALSPHRWLQRGGEEKEKELASPIRSPVAAYKWHRQQQQQQQSPCWRGDALKMRQASKVVGRSKLPALGLNNAW